MSWEAEVITVKDSLKKVERSRKEHIANAVNDVLAKFKSSYVLVAFLMKDHDTGFNARDGAYLL